MKHLIFLCLLAHFGFYLSAQSISSMWEIPTINYYRLREADGKLAMIKYVNGSISTYNIKLISKEGVPVDSFNFDIGIHPRDMCYHPQQHAFFLVGSTENNYDTTYIAKISLTGEILWKKHYTRAPFFRLILKAVCPDNAYVVAGCFLVKSNSDNAIACAKFDAEDGSLVYESDPVITANFNQKSLSRVEIGSDGDMYTVRIPVGGQGPYSLFRFDSETGAVLWQLVLTGSFDGWEKSKFLVDQNDNIHLISDQGYMLKVSPDGVLLSFKNIGYHFRYGSDMQLSGNKLRMIGAWTENPSVASPIKGPAIRIIDILTGDSLFEARANNTVPANNIGFNTGIWESDSIFYAQFYNREDENDYLGKFSISDQTNSLTPELSESSAEQIRVSPNPVTGNLVNITTTFEGGQLILYHPTGKILLNTSIQQHSTSIPIPAAPGIYWLLGISPSGQYVSTRIIR